MSKNTFFNTRFWQDAYVSDLDPIEKLLFVYCITSPSLGLTGIYELPIKNIALETGVDKEMLLKIFTRFKKEKKVIYKEGWVCVVNYPKYQRYSGEKLMVAVVKEIKAIPSHLLKYFIKNRYPIDTLSIPSRDRDMDMDKETSKKNMKKNRFGSYNENKHTDEYEDSIQVGEVEENTKPIGKEKISTNVVLDIWNSYPTFKHLSEKKKVKGEPKNTLAKTQLLPIAKATKELRMAISTQLKRHELSEIELAIDNYLRDIIMRDPKQSYASHRYSCLEFFHIKRDTLVKYINK